MREHQWAQSMLRKRHADSDNISCRILLFRVVVLFAPDQRRRHFQRRRQRLLSMPKLS
jgi:hypothetical protein